MVRLSSVHPQNEIMSYKERVRENNPEIELLEVNISVYPTATVTNLLRISEQQKSEKA